MKTSTIIKIVILVLGLVIIGVAFAFWGPAKGEATSIDTYVWINILVAYCALAGLFFTIRINVDNADSRIYSVLFIFKGLLVFAILTVGLTILVGFRVLSPKIAIIIQLVALIGCLLYVLVAVVSAGHIRNVAAEQTKLTGDIDNLRAVLNGLDVRASALPEQYDGVKKSITGLKDDLRYLSACKNQRAVQLEQDITAEVMKLEKLVKFQEDVSEMEDTCREIKLLVDERKTILN